MKYYRVAVAWTAALYRFSVRLISRTHGRTARSGGSNAHPRAHARRVHHAVSRVYARTHTSENSAAESPYTIYFIWLIRFRQRRYIAVCGNSIYARACERRAGRFVLDITVQLLRVIRISAFRPGILNLNYRTVKSE